MDAQGKPWKKSTAEQVQPDAPEDPAEALARKSLEPRRIDTSKLEARITLSFYGTEMSAAVENWHKLTPRRIQQAVHLAYREWNRHRKIALLAASRQEKRDGKEK